MFNTLMKSEIKKAEAAANKFYGRNDCKVTAWSASPAEWGFYDVECEICFDYKEAADHSVTVHAFMVDRRKSFATVN